jgi:dienelactone hydrolase
MLLAEKDDETPSATCFPMLEEYKSSAAPVAWHVYPAIGHGWDEEGRSKFGYVFNREAADDASRRTIEFIKSD